MNSALPQKSFPQGPFARFTTELRVRPDDIDLYEHAHSSRYMDFVLAARFEQMDRCYGMSMDAFKARGFGWFQRSFSINYKRQLKMSERISVETGVKNFLRDGIVIAFRIFKENKKLAADGEADFALVDLKTRWATALPDDVVAAYAI